MSGTPRPSDTRDAARLLGVIGLALTLAYAVLLTGSLLQGHWLIDSDGNPVASDFIGIWSAGRAALQGDPAGAYDWATKSRLEAIAAGYASGSFYPWLYPPPFLFIAAAFALLPVIPAAIAWIAVTTPIYAAAIFGILKRPAAIWIALGFPGALWNLSAGQNGFLTAAVLGGALALMERNPVLSGVCLGLLTCKPQYGVLFPFALIVSGRWRVFVSAAVTTAAIAVLSFVVFGPEVWDGFWRALPAANRLNFQLGGAGWDKWQSVFGLVRALGGSAGLAWALQGALAIVVIVIVTALWRRDLPFDLKAAALSAGALLVTPYSFIYDLAVLAVPVAFLLRYDLDRGFPRVDVVGLAISVVVLLSYIFITGAVGLVATLIVFALILRHAIRTEQTPAVG